MEKISVSKMNFKDVYWMLYPRKPMIFETFWSYVLQSRFVLYIHMWARFLFFMILSGGKINAIDDTKKDAHMHKVIDHNMAENFNLMLFNRGRIESILYPLMSISYVRRNAPDLKVLSIGPRNEGELLLLSKHGFKWDNILGLDLFSYSPNIKIMDMHKMTFEDNRFDIITSSRVLSYSNGLEVQKAINEMVRVAKNGAIMAIGIALDFGNEKDCAGNKFNGWLDELLGYFGDHVDYIYWRNEEEKGNGVGDMTIVFRIKK